jgi:hypothetical protein
MRAMTISDLDARPASPWLVEREAVLADLQCALEAARGGAGRLVIVRGEAGIAAILDKLDLERRSQAAGALNRTADGTPRPRRPAVANA